MENLLPSSTSFFQHNSDTTNELVHPLVVAVKDSTKGSRTLRACDDALALLNKYSGSEDVAVVFIGDSTTDMQHRSFIVSILTERMEQGLRTLEPKGTDQTGLRMWGTPLRLKPGYTKRPNMSAIFIDAYIGPEATSEEKKAIYALGFLLSSIFVYSSANGVIDQTGMSSLKEVIDLSTRILPKREPNSPSSRGLQSNVVAMRNNFQPFAPEFLWIITNYEPSISSTGRVVNDQAYLDSMIQAGARVGSKGVNGATSATSHGDSVEGQLRMFLDAFFRKRDCATLSRAAATGPTTASCPALDTSWSSLSSVFRKQILALRKKLFSQPKAKTFFNKTINLSMWVKLLTGFVLAMNNTTSNTWTIPCVEEVWDELVSTQCDSVVDQAIQFYRSTIQRTTNMSVEDPDYHPMNESDMISLHSEAAEQSVEMLIRESQRVAVEGEDTTSELVATLRTLLKNEKSKLEAKNYIQSKLYCKSLMSEFFDTDKIQIQRKGFFDTEGDFVEEQISQWIEHVRVAMEQYREKAIGPAAYVVLFEWFLNSNSDEADLQHLPRHSPIPSMMTILSDWIKSTQTGIRQSIAKLKEELRNERSMRGKQNQLPEENGTTKIKQQVDLAEMKKLLEPLTQQLSLFQQGSEKQLMLMQTATSSKLEQLHGDLNKFSRESMALSRLQSTANDKTNSDKSANVNGTPQTLARVEALEEDSRSLRDQLAQSQARVHELEIQNEKLRAKADQESVTQTHLKQELSLVRDTLELTRANLESVKKDYDEQTRELHEIEFRFAQSKTVLAQEQSDKTDLENVIAQLQATSMQNSSETVATKKASGKRSLFSRRS